jgi:hypothetical protein
MASKRHRWRIAALAVALPVAVSGSVYLVSNTVEPSHAGVTTVNVTPTVSSDSLTTVHDDLAGLSPAPSPRMNSSPTGDESEGSRVGR